MYRSTYFRVHVQALGPVVFLVDSVPVDVTAMGVLLALLLGGYVSAAEAFSGFSSPVVIVMVCTLFVSGALRVTGVSDVIARWIQSCRYAHLLATVQAAA